MREDTEQIYRKRILAVLDYIKENLDGDLNLDEIAGVAFFSPFHFHRVFCGMVGETLASLIRRLRLERAAFRLLNGVEPIMLIAIRAGYDSNQSFTRAFKTAFGETPSDFKKYRKSIPLIHAPSGYHFMPENGIQSFNPIRRGNVTMEGRIVELEQMRILSVKNKGAYYKIGEAFEKLSDIVTKNNIDIKNSQWLGIFWDDPESVLEKELRSEACVTIEGDIEIPDGVEAEAGEIPGGQYATTRHTGSYKGIGKAWGELCGIWVPQNGYKPRESACFEIYVKGSECTNDESEYITDLYEPIEPV
ncbi:MAG: AraC family transcriptional regulator [Candidatus Aegiribacteria sp.]|nr:AraC family transcriptional regulator [Candidatus Aegiribacteria sp.]